MRDCEWPRTAQVVPPTAGRAAGAAEVRGTSEPRTSAAQDSV